MKTIILIILLCELFGAYLIEYTVLATAGVRYRQSRDNCRVSGYNLGIIRSSSQTTCGLHCLLNQRCVTISYHKRLGVCELHDTCYTGCCAEDSLGWSVYYPMAKNCPELNEHRPEDFFGNPNGGHTQFTDCDLWRKGNITAIHLKLHDLGIKMTIKYGNVLSDSRGYWKGDPSVEIKFEEDEYITQVNVSAEKWVTSLHITTNKEEYGTYGDNA